MRKKIFILSLVCCATLALSACSAVPKFGEKVKEAKQTAQDVQKTDDTVKTDTSTGTKQTEAKTDGTVTAEKNQAETKTDVTTTVDKNSGAVHNFKEAKDFWVMYNGKKYVLPTDTSIFEGWKTNIVDEQLKAHQYVIGANYKKDGYTTVSVTPYNDTDSSKKAIDCKLAGLSVDSFSSRKTMEIELPNGIKIGSTYAEALQAFGKPEVDRINAGDAKLRTIEYKTGTYSYVRLTLTKDVVDGFDIRYIPEK